MSERSESNGGAFSAYRQLISLFFEFVWATQEFVSKNMAQAHQWQRWIDEGRYRDGIHLASGLYLEGRISTAASEDGITGKNPCSVVERRFEDKGDKC